MTTSTSTAKTTSKAKPKETTMTKSEQIRALAKKGIKNSEIARKLSIRPQHVYNVLKAGEPKQVRRPTKEKKVPVKVAKMGTTSEKIRALWVTKTWSQGEIAKALGIRFQFVNNTVKRSVVGFNPADHKGPQR